MYATLKSAQPRALKILENSIKNNRLSHAYLFTGPKGTYKKEMAYHLALMLYCKEEVPCYNCRECSNIIENKHLNVYYVSPLGQTIKKEQILALQEEFSKTSLVEGPRIYIIDEADTMSASAANSLLKFIEEPNEDIYGILITEHKDNILSTIISRSMVISFDELDKSLLKEQLLTLNVNPFTVETVTYLTSNIEEAKELLVDDGFKKVSELVETFANQLAEDKPVSLFYHTYSDVLGTKDRLNMFLILLECLYRDIYEYQILNNILFFKTLEEKIKIIAEKTSKDDTLKHLFQILDLIKKMGYNVNMSLLMNQFLIDLNGGL
jgi:DNA polymerase-3 subunit delta'